MLGLLAGVVVAALATPAMAQLDFADPLREKRCAIEAAERLPKLPGLVVTSIEVGGSPADLDYVAEKLGSMVALTPREAKPQYMAFLSLPPVKGAPTDSRAWAAEITAMRAHFRKIFAEHRDIARVAVVGFKAGAIEGAYKAICLEPYASAAPIVYRTDLLR